MVRPIAIAELVEGHASGALKEVFGCGTAVVISPFEGLGFQNNYYPIEAPTDSFTQMLKENLGGYSIQYPRGSVQLEVQSTLILNYLF